MRLQTVRSAFGRATALCFAVSWCSALGFGAALAAQTTTTVPDGYRYDVVFDDGTNPFCLRGFAVDPDGELFVAVGNEVLHVDRAGRTTVVHQFGLRTGAGVMRFVGADLYLVESGTQSLLRRTPTGALTAGSVPEYTFDLAAVPGTGALLASANPDWPGAGARNGIWLVDFVGGQHREIIALRGPSGPIAFDAAGNLYYAEQSDIFPTPPGAVRVVRFASADLVRALQGGPGLTLADATVVRAGLDGAYRLAVDDRGRLWWSDPGRGGVLQGGTAVPLVAPPLPPDTSVALGLAFVDSGPATFDPFQPATAGAMYVHLTDWGQRAEIVRVEPSRPTLTASPSPTVTPGVLRLSLAGLPPRGPAWLCLSAADPVASRPWFVWNGSPFWSGLDLSMPVLSLPAMADARGVVELTLTHPGGVAATAHFQAVGIAPTAALWPFGTSPVVTLSLLP